jgi:hypothetical protein
MDISFFKKLVMPLASAVGKIVKASKLTPGTATAQGGRFFANFRLLPVASLLTPNASKLRELVSSAHLPGTFEIDNLEVVASPLKSFHYGSRKAVTISLYLVSEAEGTFVVEFTILPFAGLMSVELFPQ